MNSAAPKYISATEIAKVTDLKALVNEIRLAYSRKIEAEVPKRSLILKNNPFSAFLTMPAYSEQHGIFIAKIGAVVPSLGTKSSVRSLIVAYSNEAEKAPMLFDGAEITNIKCAAVSALVTDICSHECARVLAIIGSGTQARAQIRAVSCVRKLTQIRVYSREPKNVENFIRENKDFAGQTQMIPYTSVQEAIAGADIISTATTSVEPLFATEDLRTKRLHINCMGAHTPYSSELPVDIVAEAKLIVEDLETAIAEAGEINRHAITLSELVRYDVRELKENKTIFRSTGHAFLDLLTVIHVMKGLGLQVSGL
ncbi:MAG: hypothetical protein K0S11_26 [Gammaproteobacteria bacterium]|jgi:ornithine cyclodeaminase/alanine dehydrogenase-like protein (mu-crystallin family)|nr:hypothetical protein [Gammaproteobacteria bacterium]